MRLLQYPTLDGSPPLTLSPARSLSPSLWCWTTVFEWQGRPDQRKLSCCGTHATICMSRVLQGGQKIWWPVIEPLNKAVKFKQDAPLPSDSCPPSCAKIDMHRYCSKRVSPLLHLSQIAACRCPHSLGADAIAYDPSPRLIYDLHDLDPRPHVVQKSCHAAELSLEMLVVGPRTSASLQENPSFCCTLMDVRRILVHLPPASERSLCCPTLCRTVGSVKVMHRSAGLDVRNI